MRANGKTVSKMDEEKFTRKTVITLMVLSKTDWHLEMVFLFIQMVLPITESLLATNSMARENISTTTIKLLMKANGSMTNPMERENKPMQTKALMKEILSTVKSKEKVYLTGPTVKNMRAISRMDTCTGKES